MLAFHASATTNANKKDRQLAWKLPVLGWFGLGGGEF
jgi:hypothetical protein